jgi:hypothetical protein
LIVDRDTKYSAAFRTFLGREWNPHTRTTVVS